MRARVVATPRPRRAFDGKDIAVPAGWLLRHLVAWALERGGVAGGSDAKFAVASKRGRKPDVTASCSISTSCASTSRACRAMYGEEQR